MQIDVTVNMTFEVDDDELRAYAEAYEGYDEEEDGEFDPDEYLEGFVTNELEGEEIISASNGRAWVCTVDDCSILD
jgi:hypothetical protein